MSSLFTEEENRLLTQTGPGTAMGEVMRRYWFPAFLSERLPAVDSDPFAIKLLGEELVAFRADDGRVGLMDRYCPHRRASLVLARTEDCALRCIYHGWKVDVEGRVLETPPEPVNSKFARSLRHRAYPTREAGGMVWTYMGPPELMPPFPEWPFNVLPDSHVWMTHFYQPSNWLQGMEGDLDAGHAGYLHWSREEYERQLGISERRRVGFKFLFDPRPLTALERAPWGLQLLFRYVLADGLNANFLVHPLVMPFFTLFGRGSDPDPKMNYGGAMHAWVPCDDGGHFVYSGFWSTEGPIPEEEKREFGAEQRLEGPDRVSYYSPEWTGDGYRQDRRAMRSGESFSGVMGIPTQDLAVQHSMGSIVDRTQEHLATGDFAVIQTRRYLLEVIEMYRRGEVLPGLQSDMDYRAIEHRTVVAGAETSLQDVLRGDEGRYQPEVLDGEGESAAAPWAPLPVG